MNVLFISPAFPPQFHQFCTALKAKGVTVLGLGDTPAEELGDELKAALTEYYYAADLNHYEAAHRAVAYLTWKHGRIDRVDSLNEHWLGVEARLREDFNIEGPRPAALETWRAKAGMGKVYQAAGIPYPEGIVFESPGQVLNFARKHGFPLLFKPNVGVGAARTYRVNSAQELEAMLGAPLAGYVVQRFISGAIVSYDGLVDRAGRIVFDTAHAYSSGIMEVVLGRLDVSYWSLRVIPPLLLDYGRRTVAAFGVKERFFHAEFFEHDDGTYTALEINMRPPGGFTTDLMNYTADVSVYELWASVLLGEDLSGFTFERKYHVAHASRRRGVPYANPPEAVFDRIRPHLLWHRWMPEVLAGAMGDEMFLLRDPDLAKVRADIAFIQAR